MRNFIVIWLGQTVSLIGSQMTNFAITIWVWELTGQATALALFGLLTQAPRVLVTGACHFCSEQLYSCTFYLITN